jgi:ribonuclease VapC
MMFVDAAALVAILTLEPEAVELAAVIDARSGLFTSPIAVFETVGSVARKSKLPIVAVSKRLQDFLDRVDIETRPINSETGELALDASAIYGKGSGHPARLNLGDCFAYAMTKQHGVPLLYKGDDFAHTDLA